MPLGSFLKIAKSDLIRVGAVSPSSKYTIKKILACLPEERDTVLEYGAGDGVITKEIAHHMPEHGKLLALETNETFITSLHQLKDPRIIPVHGMAQDAHKFANEHGIAAFDVVISGIPFSTLKSPERKAIVKATFDILKPGGTFIVYQNSPLMLPYLKKHFTTTLRFEPRNFLPYFIMCGKKKNTTS